MTLTIGLLLLIVFLGFAAAMFLERLSALLALPLMAVAFLSVALVGDLLQPETVTELAAPDARAATTRPTTPAERTGPSRFAQWQDFRWRRAAYLAELTRTYRGAVLALLFELRAGDSGLTVRDAARGQGLRTRLLAVLERYAQQDEALRRGVLERAAQIDAQFARPPHVPGPRATLEDELKTIPFATLAADVQRVVEAAPHDAAAAASAAVVLDRALGGVPAMEERHPDAPPLDGWFTARGMVSYVAAHFLLLFRAGSLQFYATIIATIFGGMFAMYVRHLRIAERLVYWTAEFAGERPFLIALIVFIVTAVVFTSVGGLGTVIMLGTIILPILRSVGLGPIVAAGTFLIAIALGGTLNPVARRLWLDFYGLGPDELDRILWIMVGLYTACGVAWIAWGTRRRLLSSFDAVAADAPRPAAVPARLLLAPLVPVALVYFVRIEEISAFLVTLAYMYLCVCLRPGATRQLSRALIEGAQAVMPPALLMIGIGLLVTALGTAPVKAYLRPLLAAAVPASQVGYVALFALAAPLALYRGPLNVWGMGLAVSATLLATSPLPPAAILGAILAAGMLQGVCDPTNTANVWIAGFQGVGVNQILRYTLLPVWLAAAAAVVIFGFLFVGP